MRIGFAILAAAAALLSGPAAAQMVSAKDPQTLVAALQAKGFQAELGTTAGEPSINSGAGGLKFKIFFENCTGGKACTTVTFFTGFTDVEATLAKVNEWNSRNRFTRAYIDKENDPVLAMDVDLDHQGMARVNFGEYLDIWSSLAPKYLAFLRGR
jgi:Putative bacterial sensory transduction regulator